jgi:hypothetical protein
MWKNKEEFVAMYCTIHCKKGYFYYMLLLLLTVTFLSSPFLNLKYLELKNLISLWKVDRMIAASSPNSRMLYNTRAQDGWFSPTDPTAYTASSQFLSFVQLLFPSPCSVHHCACHLFSSQIAILQSVQFHHCSSLLIVQLTTVPAICAAYRL